MKEMPFYQFDMRILQSAIGVGPQSSQNHTFRQLLEQSAENMRRHTNKL